MAVKYSQIGELLSIVVRQMGRTRFESMLKDVKRSQAFTKNQSFRETIERLERQLRTGKPKPPKEPLKEQPKGGPRSGRSDPYG